MRQKVAKFLTTKSPSLKSMGTSSSQVGIIASLRAKYSEEKIEFAFVAIFSALIFAIFYVLISMNGVVLGNDPAVHLEKAQIFLNTGKIPLANLGLDSAAL